jgi:F-type H+-transporting ATPase subunit b
MLINWFTVAAQIINFLALVILLRIFLYDRIVRVLKEREEKIQGRFDNAEKKQAEAEEEAETFRKKQQDLEAEQNKLMEQAREEAGNERKKLIESAREEADQYDRRWRESVRRQREDFLREARETVVSASSDLTRRMLDVLANAHLETEMARAFADRIENADKEKAEELRDAMKEGDTLTVLTAFAPDEDSANRISEALHNRFGEDRKITFEKEPALICGMELRAAGHAVGWSLAGYREHIENRFDEMIENAAAAGETADAPETEAEDAGGKNPEGPPEENEGNPEKDAQ